MSRSKIPKEVMFLLNDNDFAENLHRAIYSMGYAPVRVGSIAEAKEKLKQYNFYAVIFPRYVPNKDGEPPSQDAGWNYLVSLIRKNKHLRLGYHSGHSHFLGKYKPIEKRCTRIDAKNVNSAKKGLQELLK